MNGARLYDVFTSNSLLKKNFRGIVRFRDICKHQIYGQWSVGDFLIINLKNAHWLSLLWTKADSLILFDTLGGLLTFNKKVMKMKLVRCFGVKNVQFQYASKHGLQKKGSLTCAEHNIYYALFQNMFYLENGFFEAEYVDKFERYCRKRKIDPDKFVWNEIYVNLKLTDPPDLKKVLSWYSEE